MTTKPCVCNSQTCNSFSRLFFLWYHCATTKNKIKEDPLIKNSAYKYPQAKCISLK
jgi:hypothetical protein